MAAVNGGAWLILLGMIALAVLAAYDKTTHEGER